MPNLEILVGLRLRGGCHIALIELSKKPLVDALGREASAQTVILGNRLSLRIRAGLTPRELSITLYHEILEAVAVSSLHPPEQMTDFNEGDFERVAHAMHAELGEASPGNLNHMLQLHGF